MFRKYAHLVLLCAVLTLSACGVRNPQFTDKDIQVKGANLRELTSSRTVSVVDEPYLGASAVPMSEAGRELSRHVSLSMVGTLGEVCSAAAPQHHLVGCTRNRTGTSGGSLHLCGHTSPPVRSWGQHAGGSGFNPVATTQNVAQYAQDITPTAAADQAGFFSASFDVQGTPSFINRNIQLDQDTIDLAGVSTPMLTELA